MIQIFASPGRRLPNSGSLPVRVSIPTNVRESGLAVFQPVPDHIADATIIVVIVERIFAVPVGRRIIFNNAGNSIVVSLAGKKVSTQAR